MTLKCTSGHRSANKSSGGTSPNRCSSPLDFVAIPGATTSSDCINRQEGLLLHSTITTDGGVKNVKMSNSSSLSSITLGTSPHTNTFMESMKRIEISFSTSPPTTSSSSSSLLLSQTPSRVPPDPNKDFSSSFRSLSCAIISDADDEQLIKLKKEMQLGLRGILKKSKSADSATVAHLRTTLLESKCLSISLSDPNLAIDVDDCDDDDEPRSPNKNVTFADDNDMSLCRIHNFVPSNDNLDQWQFNCVSNNQQRLFKSDRLSGNQAMVPKGSGKLAVRKPNQLVVCFKEPCDNADFKERFKYKCVALERCATRDRTVTGIVLVKNIEFHKEVAIRYTLDSWVTSTDVDACYLPNSNDGDTDRFSFSLALPRNHKEMEFAIRYKTGTAEYWDNNFNRNYKVKDALTPF